jgi:hypothetical protein
MLSEHDIKTIFLPFLKEFYRYRYEYQPDTEQSSLDNVSADGLVADGLLRFRKNDGDTFTCTYEASSLDKIQEVKFSLNTNYFLWDCAAFGATCAAAVYAWMYATRLDALRLISLPGKLGLPLGVALIGFFVWYFFMRNWKKYRYVHAVEQFKRYHADEQWVAISEDVFPAPTDPYFLELKDQCVYGGFGLAIVQFDRSVRVVAAPSRLGVLGADRKMQHWLTRTEWYQAVSSRAQAAAQYKPPVPGVGSKLTNTVMRPLRQYIFRPVAGAFGRTANPAVDAYQRFTGEHLIQKWICTIAIVLVGTFTYRAAQHQTERVADRTPQIFQPEQKEPPESPERRDGYVVSDDETPIPYGKNKETGRYYGVPRQDPEPAEDEGPTLTVGGSDEEEADETPTTQRSTTAPTNRNQGRKTAPNATSSGGGSLCERIKSAGGWIVQDNVFSTSAFATDRVRSLRKAGITCEAFSGSCLGEKGWIVRLGYSQPAEKTARAKAADYENLLTRAGLRTGKVIIRKVK